MDTNQTNDEALRAAREEGAKAEAGRQNEIRAIAQKVRLADVDVSKMLADPTVSVSDARGLMLDLVAERSNSTEIRGQVQVTRDEGDTRLSGIVAALEHRAGLTKELPAVARDLRGSTLIDLASARLSMDGVNVRGMGRQEIAHLATRAPAGHTSSDFPLVLAGVANKVLQAAFAASPDYHWFERIGTRNDFSDYKTRYLPNLKGLGVLPTVVEGAEYQGVTTGEYRESVTPLKKGAEFRLTKEMVSNDDLGAFVRMPREFGEAAIRTASSMCLTAVESQVMGDGKALYHADHDNLGTTGGAPDIDKLAELDQLLRDQTDGNGAVVGRPATFLFAPTTLRKKIEQLFSQNWVTDDPTEVLIVGLDAGNRVYIPGMSGTAYYLGTGDQGAFEFGYLAEEGGPVVSKYPDFNSDSVIFHATMTFGACVAKWQGFAKNPGA